MVINWTKTDSPNPPSNALRIRAAEYVRMSTEHQKYSTDNQSEAIRNYADKRGYEVVRTYADEGKSGLNIEGRAGLRTLIADVEAGRAKFEALLVYDVSRWGRFQDPDEAASYELRCRRAGVQVHYCAEQFENDGSIGASIIKTVKRAMAGEYSRELSVKVFAGQANLIRLGYRQGGAAGFGLRRMLLDQSGMPKAVLEIGEHKSITTDRVVLVPGPEAETEIVREIYREFVVCGRSERQIADSLNRRGVLTDMARPWKRAAVHQLLINEKYIGNNVWARTSFKLKGSLLQNAPENWIRSDGAFEAIVDRDLFSRAQAIIQARSARLTDEHMLEMLRLILEKRGALSGMIIDEFEDYPSSSAFRSRFGSLLRAYSLIGFTPDHDYRFLETNRKLRQLYPGVVGSIVAGIKRYGGWVYQDSVTDIIRINSEFTVSIAIMRCFQTESGSLRWKLRLDSVLRPDITVGVRMNSDNSAAKDYYLLPHLDMQEAVIRLAEFNGLSLDAYRCDTPELLFRMGSRVPIQRAA